MTRTLIQPTGPAHTRIYSYGAARGEIAVPNDDLIGPIDSSDEWIRQRTGIITRTRAVPETTCDRAGDGCRSRGDRALGRRPAADRRRHRRDDQQSRSRRRRCRPSSPTASARTPPPRTTSTPRARASRTASRRPTPSSAPVPRTTPSSSAPRSSATSSIPTDRSISFLLGDGAGAVVIGPSDTPGIGPTVWGSDGSKADAVGMNHTLNEFRDGQAPWPTLRQEGPTVFRWAVWEMVKVARQALEAAGVEASDLAAFVPHQANMRIIDEFAKQLRLPDTVVIGRDIETTGNTSAASIPLATHRLLEEHPELSGGLALQIGFGAGLVFGAQVVVLP